MNVSTKLIKGLECPRICIIDKITNEKLLIIWLYTNNNSWGSLYSIILLFISLSILNNEAKSSFHYVSIPLKVFKIRKTYLLAGYKWLYRLRGHKLEGRSVFKANPLGTSGITMSKKRPFFPKSPFSPAKNEGVKEISFSDQSSKSQRNKYLSVGKVILNQIFQCSQDILNHNISITCNLIEIKWAIL